MQVTIEQKTEIEKEGKWYNKTETTYYRCAVHVTFSEQEKSIIHHRNLSEYVILEGVDPVPVAIQRELNIGSTMPWQITVKMLLDPKFNGGQCYTPHEALKFEADITDALKRLKAFIEENAEAPTGSKTFEL